MFIVSKLFWSVVQPSNLLVILLVAGSVALLAGRRTLGTWLVATVSAALLLVTFLPLGQWLVMPLENRFPAGPLPEHLDGIIVLGGPVEICVSAARGEIALNDSAERATELVALARRYPAARLVFTGGSGELVGCGATAAAGLHTFYASLGLDPGRITFEDRSRNTYENALFSKRLVDPKPGDRWLLVTSAYHMPRSVGVFRQAGWPVIAYPVDYRTTGRPDLQRTLDQLVQPSVSDRLFELDLAIKAWVGLLAYRLMGRTSALFPAP